MPEIRPFRAILYNSNLRKIMSKLIAPPYDIIDEAMQDDLYNRHILNSVRLILAKQYPSDNDEENRYTRTKKLWEEWQRDGLLVRDDKPSIYVYEQEFEIKGEKYIRTAIITAMRLHSFDEGKVLPHEKTKSAPKIDRLNLYYTTKSNMCPIFGLHEADINKFFDKKELLYEAQDDDSIKHRLYRITDENSIESIKKAIYDVPVFIADGHHRYDTTLMLKEKMNAGEDDPAAFTLIALVSMKDKGLSILPTHRLLKNAQINDDIINKISNVFEIKEVDSMGVNELPDKFSLLLYANNKHYLLKVKDKDKLFSLMPSEQSQVWKEISSNILYYGILKPVFGIQESDLKNVDVLGYEADDNISKDKVNKGEYSAAFIIPAISLQDFAAVSNNRELLPPKSTYFYPKIASGLLFRDLTQW